MKKNVLLIKETLFNDMISRMTYSELLKMRDLLDNEIRLSETAIKEGFEVEK